MISETRKRGEKPLGGQELIELAQRERGEQALEFISLFNASHSSVLYTGSAWYPFSDNLNRLSLTERSWLALTELQTIPGGAGGNRDTVLDHWISKVEENREFLAKGKRIQIIAGIHGALPAEVLLQRRDGTAFFAEVGSEMEEGATPANVSYAEGLAGASSILHAECSCGASGGKSENIRWKAGENVIRFMDHVSRHYPEVAERISVIPVEAVYSSYDLTEAGLPDIRFILGEGLSINNLGQYLDSTTGDFLTPFQTPSRNNLDRLLTGSQIDEYLREMMNRGILLKGTGCVDSRQGFLIPPENRSPLLLQDIPHAWNAEDGWQGEAHSEHSGILIVNHDERMLKLAYELATMPFYLERTTNWANHKGSPSLPFLLNVSWEDFDGKKGRQLKKTLQNLFSAMDTEVYRRTADTGPQPTQTYMRRQNGDVKKVELGNGFRIFADDREDFLDDVRPGILIFPANAEENRGQVWPGTRRKNLVIKVQA